MCKKFLDTVVNVIETDGCSVGNVLWVTSIVQIVQEGRQDFVRLLCWSLCRRWSVCDDILLIESRDPNQIASVLSAFSCSGREASCPWHSHQAVDADAGQPCGRALHWRMAVYRRQTVV